MAIKDSVVKFISGFDHRFNLKLSIPITFSVLVILAAARLLFHVPKTFLLLIGGIFLFWSVVYWIWMNNRQEEITIAAVGKKIGTLLALCLATSALLLGSIYSIDRAGWLWYRFTGYETIIPEDLSSQVDLSIDDFLQQYPFFKMAVDVPTTLILTEGEYIIEKTIVIPRNLTLVIEPGTVLRFSAGRSLISYSPILARGTESKPISFIAKNRLFKWGVVGVVKSKGTVFEYVKFEDAREALVNGINFLGGLSLIETDGNISHSEFLNSYGKDAVNINKGVAMVQDNLFQDVYRDCLDYDGAMGEISHNQFINCGDEGIDLGGNFNVEVIDNTILDPRGGRISAEHDLDKIISQNTFGYSDEEGQ
jgi:hypothetical protein